MTPPNLLTILRILLVPVFMLLLLYGRTGTALLVFMLAGVTDLLDGLLARKFNHGSELGALLDPIADKLLLVSSFILLSLPSMQTAIKIPVWLVVAVISRDILIVIAVIVTNLAFGKHRFLPSIWGKMTTASQILTVLAVLVCNAWGTVLPITEPLFFLTLALTVISGLHYVTRGMRLQDYQV